VRPAMNMMSTMQGTFEQEVPLYAAAGFEGIGLLEMHLPDDNDTNRRLIEQAGLQVSNCIITVLSILPLQGVVLPDYDWRGIDFEGPTDTEERISRICSAVRRLGPYRPSSVTVSFGSPDSYPTHREAETALREGLRRVADTAEQSGVRIAIEPIHPSIINSFGQSIAETAHIIDDAGVADVVGILIDTWHSGDSPTLFEDVAAHGDRVIGLHLSDRAPAGNPNRLAPGTGVSPTAEILRGLRAHGYDTFADAELFSPTEFWEMPLADAVTAGYAATRGVIDKSATPA
jgi:sugar phosphate isomerase/epimerase